MIFLHSLSAFPLSISVDLSLKLCSILCGSKFCFALTIWQVFNNLRPLQPWRCLQLTFFACRCLKVFLANIFQAAGQAGKCCKCKVTLEILPPLSSGSVMLLNTSHSRRKKKFWNSHHEEGELKSAYNHRVFHGENFQQGYIRMKLFETPGVVVAHLNSNMENFSSIKLNEFLSCANTK